VDSARFQYPTDVTFDGAGALLVADRDNHVIRSISGGKVSTLAGTGTAGSADGSALSAQFTSPVGLAVDGTGKIVYVADRDNNKIRKIASGSVSTLAGSGKKGFLDGAGSSAQFAFPAGLAVDAAGQLIVADAFNNSLRRVTLKGVVSTLAGAATPGLVNGPALSARFDYPSGVALDGAGALLIVDMDNHCLRRLASGTVSTIAGTGNAGNLDGPAASAKFHFPVGLAINGGAVYIADQTNNVIRKLAGGTVSTLAGAGTKGFKDGPTGSALFSFPSGVAVDKLGRVYVADSDNNRIRIIQP
jgi:DNA-binding beta-propeller fold protein YncE